MKLSKTQSELVDYMKANGSIIRMPGGIWIAEKMVEYFKRLSWSDSQKKWFGTQTVKAAARKGIIVCESGQDYWAKYSLPTPTAPK